MRKQLRNYNTGIKLPLLFSDGGGAAFNLREATDEKSVNNLCYVDCFQCGRGG